MENILIVKNLKKNYKKLEAVKGVSFTIEKGSFFSFIGHNGAGKSTTINMISTLLEKTSGEIIIDGLVIGEDDEKIRKKIGIVFQDSLLDKNLTVEENLRLRASFYKMNKIDFDKRIKDLNNTIMVNDIIKQRYGSLSGGQRRRVDILNAIINLPKILILDEPTTGLDPKSRKIIWNSIKNLQKDRDMTVFLTTHYMEETLCSDKVIIIHHGEIICEGTPETLRNEHTQDTLNILSNNLEELEEELRSKDISFEVDKDKIIVKINNSKEAIPILSNLKKFDSFEVRRGTMDDVFLNVISNFEREGLHE